MEVIDSMINISLSTYIILICISALIIRGLVIWYNYTSYKEEKEHIEMPSKLTKNYVSELINNLEKEKRARARRKN